MADVTSIIDTGLVGTWVSHEGESSSVKYTVSISQGSPTVAAIDTFDSERGEVSGVQWDSRSRALLFTCFWQSTGRLAKCRFQLTGQNSIQFTYQYTDHEVLVRGDA